MVRNFYKYAALLPLLLAPVLAQAATLSAVSSGAKVEVGSTVSVSVSVDSEGVAINNAEGTLTFPTDLFDVVSVNQSPSIFTLWIQSPSYSGSGVSFNGGLPAPGYTGSGGRLFSVVLRAKAAGSGAFTIAGGAVRANDGLGTDVLRATGGAGIVVAQPAAAAPVPTPTPAAAETPAKPVPSGSIEISSATHPSQDAWYSAPEAELAWKVPTGADAVQTLVSKIKGVTPSVIYRPAIAQKTISNLEDGVWYFNLRAHTAAGWGPISSYRLQVDRTPPTLADVQIRYNGDEGTLVLSAADAATLPRGLSFDVAANDAGSGINKLQILVDNRIAATIPASDFHEGTYTLPVTLTTGEHSAALRAVDEAGNQSDSPAATFTVAHVSGWAEELWGRARALSPMWLLLMAALALSCLSLLMNFILWKKLRSAESRASRARLSKSVVGRVQRETKQNLQALKKNLQKQDKSLQKANTRPDVTPQEAAYLKKVRGHLAEAEAYLDEKMREVDKP